MREKKERAREKRLQDIKDQVASGNLVIRKMTAAEREKYPPVANTDKKPPKERRSYDA